MDETYSYDNIKFDSQMHSLTWGGSLECEWNGLNNHNLVAGVKVSTDQTKRRDVDVTEDWTNSSVRTISVYTEDNCQLGQNMMLTAGVGSYSYYMKETDRSISSLGYMTGLSKQWSESIKTRLAASRSVFFPTQHNLYSPGKGNPDLKPEEAQKYELSLELNSENRYQAGTGLQLTLFLQQTRNQIDLSVVTNQFININEIDSWGIEAVFSHELSRWLGLECGVSTINWNLNNGTLYNTPNLKLNGRMLAQTPFRTNAFLEASWFDERKGDNTQNLPSYLVVNGNVSYSLKQWITLKLVMRNIFDTNYEEVYGYPGLGRQILGGFEVRMQ